MEVVEREEAQATVKAKETQAIADDAQRDLNEALPALVWPFDSITLLDNSNENYPGWVECQIILFLWVGDLKALNFFFYWWGLNSGIPPGRSLLEKPLLSFF